MKKADLLKLLAENSDDDDITSIIMENSEFKPQKTPTPAEPQKTPTPADPIPIKSDTSLTVTAADLARIMAEMTKKQSEKEDDEEEENDAEIYI